MQPIKDFPELEFIGQRILPPPRAIEFRPVNLAQLLFEFSFEGEQSPPRLHEYNGRAWVDRTEPLN
jgi:hypothetical protein